MGAAAAGMELQLDASSGAKDTWRCPAADAAESVEHGDGTDEELGVNVGVVEPVPLGLGHVGVVEPVPIGLGGGGGARAGRRPVGNQGPGPGRGRAEATVGRIPAEENAGGGFGETRGGGCIEGDL